MGGGSYSYSNSVSRGRATAAKVKGVSSSYYSTMSVADYADAMSGTTTSEYQKVFTSRSLDKEMNIKGQVRESCDSDEHPTSYPIIIGLDVTGSMSSLPGDLITQAFPEIMKGIMDAGIEHAQVCFVGIGDDTCDEAPIQVGQFETSDELTEKWLQKIYLEGGGGGNYGESYGLCWYFAARHTKIDSFDKRGVKGCLITVGDEPILQQYSKHSIKSLFGDTIQDNINIKNLYEEVSEKWNVYHIKCGGWSDRNWNTIPKDHIISTNRNVNDIAKGIIEAIIKSYPGKQTVTYKKETVTETPSTETIL